MQRKEVQLQILVVTNCWIVFDMDMTDSHYMGTCVFLYGEPNRSLRSTFWPSFVNLITSLNGPIIVLSDWNCLWSTMEKRGGQPTRLQDISYAQHILDQCLLFDIDNIDPPHTWTNGQQVPNRILERIDKATINSQWRVRFPRAYLQVFPFYGSDHYLILLRLSSPFGRLSQKPFRFEWFWNNYEQCQTIIEAVCNSPSSKVV